LDVPQYLYAILVGVVLVAVLAAWIVVRVRNRVGSLRIEPGMGTASSGTLDETPIARPQAPASPTMRPVADIVTAPQPDMPSTPLEKLPNGVIEQGYKGFRISLREKQPGLWVASIFDSARNRRRSAEDRKMPVTREHYHMPGALAEAKGMIDHRLAAGN